MGAVGGAIPGPLGQVIQTFGGMASDGGNASPPGSDTSPAVGGSWWNGITGWAGRTWANRPGWLGGGGASGGNAPTGPMGDRGAAMMNRLVQQHGWTPQAAAIAAGNAQQESRFNTGAAGDPNVPGGSHGLFQWNRERFAALQSFAARQGKDWHDFNTQVDFFAQEAEARNPGWKSVTSLANAGAIGWNYERYGDNSTGTRVANAQRWLRRYNETGSAVATNPGWPSSWTGISPAQAGEALRQVAPQYNSFGSSLGGSFGAFGSSPYPPASGGSITHDNSDKHSELNQKTTINVYAGDNEEIGSTIARHQSSVNANLIRDMSGKAVG